MEKDSAPLDANAILIAEYEYIVQTAMQANEDRARVSNYYLVAAGAAVAAIIGAGFEVSMPGVYLGFSLLFAGLAIIGLLTLLQLARLRKAWRDLRILTWKRPLPGVSPPFRPGANAPAWPTCWRSPSF